MQVTVQEGLFIDNIIPARLTRYDVTFREAMVLKKGIMS